MTDSCDSKAAGSWDAKDGFLDNHAACRSCLRKSGIFCTRERPCIVGASWPSELWDKVSRADIWSARHHQIRAEKSGNDARASRHVVKAQRP